MLRVEKSHFTMSSQTILSAENPCNSIALEKLQTQEIFSKLKQSNIEFLFEKNQIFSLGEHQETRNNSDLVAKSVTNLAKSIITPNPLEPIFEPQEPSIKLDAKNTGTSNELVDLSEKNETALDELIFPENHPDINEELWSLLHEEVPELTEMLGKKTDWLDAIYMLYELMKLNIEGKTQERLFRISERKVQLEQIEDVVKNLEKTAKDQFSAGLMGGLTGIFSGLTPMFGFTKIGESCLGAFQSSFNTLKGLKPVDAFEKLGKMLQSMSQMEQGMMDVRKTTHEATRHRSTQYTEITRSYCDDSARNEQDRNQDHQATLQALLNLLNQNREIVTSLYGN